MYCPECGTELPDDSIFCDACGARVYDDDEQEQVKATENKQPSSKNPILPLLVFILMTVIVCVGVIFLKGSSGNKTDMKESVETGKPESSGEDSSDNISDETVEKDTDQDAVADKDIIEDTDKEEEPAAENEISNEEPDQSPEGWLESQGLSLSDEYSFELETDVLVSSQETGKTATVPVTVQINESKPSSAAGYKEVTASFTCDGSALSEDDYPVIWFSAFDRDTGIWLESAGQKQFDVYTAIDNSQNVYPKRTVTLYVTCPEDYDGTMFYCGYQTAEMRSKGADFSKSCTVDELPFWDKSGKGYYFYKGE